MARFGRIFLLLILISAFVGCASQETTPSESQEAEVKNTPETGLQTGPAETKEADQQGEDSEQAKDDGHPDPKDIPEARPLDPDLPVFSQIYDPERDAAADLKAAMDLAENSHRRIIMKVGGNWCPWCKLLDGFIHENQDVYMALHDNFVFIKVNVSDENKNEDFLSAYPKIEGYPHLFVLDAQGKLLHSQNTALLEEGKGYNLEKVQEFLAAWIPIEDEGP